MTIRRKVLAVVAATAAGFVVLIVAGALVLSRVQTQLTTIENQLLPMVQLEPELDAQLERIARAFQDAVGARDRDALAATATEKAKFLSLLDGARDAVEPDRAASLRVALDTYYASAHDVSERMLRDDSGEAFDAAIKTMQSDQARVSAHIKTTAALDRTELHGAFASAHGGLASAGVASLVVSLVCLAFVLTLCIFLTRDILRSFERLTAGFARFGDGNFGERIAIVGSDELADVARQANTMAASLERLYREQKRAEKRFRDLMNNAPDALVIVNDDEGIDLVNAQTEKLFGYARDELVGQPADMLLPERHRGKGWLHHPNADDADTDLQGRHKNGREIPIDVTRGPLETDAGRLVSSAIRDVTERKRIQAELQASNRELEAFSYSVAHDLRSPLRGINGFSQALLEDWGDKLDGDARKSLDRICAAAERMGALIDALLSLARVTRARISREDIDMTALAESVMQQLRAGQPERTIEFDNQPKLTAHGDPALVRAVLENLMGNAWKFSANNAAARISFGVEPQAGVQTFFVRDNGAGFDMAYAEKLFAPFQRLHTVREFGGTGIGLATVQRIIHRHGGRIWAEAAVGKGATFRFTVTDDSSR